jgi:hypothetical protein
MSRLPTIFRRRGGDSGSGQETQGQNAPASGAGSAPNANPGFRDRGKLRRRLRYLRRVRDLQLRDLGGLVYETYRQKRPRQDLVDRKVGVLAATDSELSGLEAALDDRKPLRELRIPGIGGECPRCGEVYASAARFCSNCGAGLAHEADAALGQFGGAPAAAPGPTPAPGGAPAAAPAASVLANWSSAGAIPTPATRSGAPAAGPAAGAAAGAAAASGAAARGPSGAPTGAPAPAGTAGAAPGTPAASPGGAPSAPGTPAPSPPAGAPTPAAPPTGDQGVGSGDPLGQPAPAAPAPSGRQGMGSGDPLGQAAPAAPAGPKPGLHSGDPLAGPAPAPAEPPTEQQPAPEDETVIMRANSDDASRNGGDESHTKAPATRSPDEPE